MLLNISNHPSHQWSEKQLQAAIADWNGVIDYQFPAVPASASTADVIKMAEGIVEDLHSNESYADVTAILIQGEFSLVINLANMLKGVCEIVVATSERNTILNPDGSKTVKFDFCQFRTVFYHRFMED